MAEKVLTSGGGVTGPKMERWCWCHACKYSL